MGEFYHELILSPSSYLELFSDFLLEATGEGIEEEGNSIIVRSEQDLSWLIEALQEFCQTLSARVSEEVNFSHSLTWKRNEDWIERYRQSIEPIECAPFYVRPSWHPPKPDLIDLLIDPALAFGSGHHGTTNGCLACLGALELEGKRVLDVGCGSGILAIASAKKGAIVEMCDTDELAVGEALKNASLNQVIASKVWIGSVGDAEGEYDLIIANILAAILIMLSPWLKERLKPGARLILSGILEPYKEDVLRKFGGFTLEKELLCEEWVTLQLRKN